MKTALSLLLLSGTLIFFSCKKSGSTSQSPYVINGFTWIYNNITTVTTFDTAYEYPTNPPPDQYQVAASVSGGAVFFATAKFHFMLASLNVGTYNIQYGSSFINSLQFVDDAGNVLVGIAGTFQITSRANNRISGNFSVTLLDHLGNNIPMTGYFSEMAIIH